MDQRTHAWTAIRAVGLLEDVGTAPGLVDLLKPYVKSAAIGAWMPDLRDTKIGGGDVDNHIMKMKPFKGDLQDRYVISKKKLLKQLGPARRMTPFIRDRADFTQEWWDTPYKANPHPGQHLANRAMSLGITLTDFLILGDNRVEVLVPGENNLANKVDKDARTRSAQAATYFFMLSHFLADSCMPCHCDARPLAAYDNGLHKEMESDWAKQVGTYFEKKKIGGNRDNVDTVLNKARDVDAKFGGLRLPGQADGIPGLKNGEDVWSEIMHVCRGSFVINSVIAPPDEYSYRSSRKAPFDTVFAGADGEELREEMNQTVMHDAVLNTAIVWKHIWDKFK